MTPENIRADWNKTEFTEDIWVNKHCVDVKQDEIADWWLAKFAARDAEVKAAIAGMRKSEDCVWNGTTPWCQHEYSDGFCAVEGNEDYNQALTDAVALFDQVRVKT